MTERKKAPWHLWAVGIVSLLWNFGGIMSYMATKTGNLDMLGMASEFQGYFYAIPAWVVAFWALGVWGCFFGSAALLLRSKWAVTLFGISLVGLFVTTIHQRLIMLPPEGMQTFGQDMFAVAIWVITLALLFYSRRMAVAGVLK